MSDNATTRGGPSFRPAVGALILNGSGKLLIGQRSDSMSSHWQFPQGGVKERENPEEAILREVREEVGTSKVRILGVLPRRTRYVWSGGPAKSPFDGQSHIWFVMRLDGEPEEEARSEEFSAFDWIDPSELLMRTHPVRHGTYQEVSHMLQEWLSAHASEIES